MYQPDPANPPTLRVLSLGAGVQSTALALLAATGGIDPIDAAVFSDTGWEPAAVYDHLNRLEAEVLIPAGIPLYRVSAGNLRDDLLGRGRDRYGSIPVYTLAAPYDVPIEVTCPTCAGEVRAALDAATLDPVEECPECGYAGVVDSGETRPATIAERSGMVRRTCTKEYKLEPIKAKVRELLGAPADPGTGRPGRVPRGRFVEQLIGISRDEVQRARDSDIGYARNRFPLLELGLTRADCDRVNRRHGFPDTAKSACLGCPFHGNAAWRRIRDTDPAGWADVVAFDEALREPGSAFVTGVGTTVPLRGAAYLHRSRVPLAEAPIDRVTSAEHAASQLDLLDAIADAELEEELGAEVGCSPFACRDDGR